MTAKRTPPESPATSGAEQPTLLEGETAEPEAQADGAGGGEPPKLAPPTPEERREELLAAPITFRGLEVDAGLAVIEPGGALEAPIPGMTWTRDQVELVKKTVAKGSSDDELRLFMHVCSRTGLDPFAKQIYFIKRWDSQARTEVFQPQTAIDGLRLIAERTQEFRGRLGPWWCGEDGDWKEVWTDAKVPAAAKVAVVREGREPTVGVALMSEFRQTKDGKPVAQWRDPPNGMPVHMLAKCAEALALRAAFPQELGDVYSFEEMAAPAGQGDRADETVENGTVVEGEVVEDTLASDAELDALEAAMRSLTDQGQTGWDENAIIFAAAQQFSRQITRLADLRSSEVAKILAAAKQRGAS
jgi:phage recombination protein Bet